MTVHPAILEQLGRNNERELRHRLAQAHRPDSRTPGTTVGQSAELVAVVEAARSGDQAAWEALVARFTPLLRATAREYRLQVTDVDDCVQATWESAFTHFAQLREPAAVAGWLAAIARRSAIRILRSRQREIPVDEPSEPSPIGQDEPAPEHGVVQAERKAAVHAAVRRLPDRQRAVITAFLDAKTTSYAELSAKLTMPVGSIGPTRERALDRLSRDRRLVAAVASSQTR